MSAAAPTNLLLFAGSLSLALFLTLVPLPDWAAMARPAFYPAAILFWVLYAPRHFGVIAAWFCGLPLDVIYATPLGQYALAVAVAAFAAHQMRNFLWALPPLQQGVVLLPVFVLYEFLLFWIDGVNGRQVDPLWRWLPALTSGLVWPLWSVLLERFALYEVKS